MLIFAKDKEKADASDAVQVTTNAGTFEGGIDGDE
jgi:hypothetical protein